MTRPYSHFPDNFTQLSCRQLGKKGKMWFINYSDNSHARLIRTNYYPGSTELDSVQFFQFYWSHFLQESLDAHMLTHSGDKPYKCCFCGKGFKNRYHVRDHENTHTDNAEHKCTVCDKVNVSWFPHRM